MAIGCALDQARNQAASARSLVSLTCDRYTVVGDLRIAFEDQVRLHFRVQRALHLVTLAGDAPSSEAHGIGGGDDLAAVVGGVTESDQIDHELMPIGAKLINHELPGYFYPFPNLLPSH